MHTKRKREQVRERELREREREVSLASGHSGFNGASSQPSVCFSSGVLSWELWSIWFVIYWSIKLWIL